MNPDRTEETAKSTTATAAELEAVIAAWQGPLLRYAARLVRDHDHAQDIVQEVFLRYLKSPPAHQEAPRVLSTWLFRVAHNLCVDLIRKENRMKTFEEPLDAAATVAAPDTGGLAQMETREQLELLLARLNENQRAVLVLKVQEGKSYREISEITGLSVGNVGFLIHQAMKKLALIAREMEAI